MVFNWFRRQYSDKSDQPDDEQAQPAPAQSEDKSAESAAETTQSPEVAEDYLKWAKAAYKNIQKQQQQPETEATISQEEIPATVADRAVEPVVEEVPSASETAVTEDSTAQTTEEVVTPESVEAVATEMSEPAAREEREESVEAVAPSESDREVATDSEPATLTETAESTDSVPELEVATPEPQTILEGQETTTEEEVAPLPFWARAQAERLERMERLKETAIETPEPETVSARSATPDYLQEIPGLAFDEGFLWSAEILASQGRRPDDISIEEITWLKKLRQGLDKTRRSLINQLKAIVGQGPLNQAGVTEIEALLLQADVGVEATDYIINALQTKLKEEALPPEEAIAYLKEILRDMLDRPTGKSYNLTFAPEKEALNIWLITGVNGAGKTTTIGKLSHLGQKSGYRCLIGAADTFRAAAVEQVKVWGQRSGVEVIANPGKNTDPAAVVFDAIAAAKARDTQLLLIDTAGRLQNKKNLMEELSKIRRIIDKKAPDGTKIESLLVLDATLGQNGLRQAEVFAEVAQLSGVILTKLDGTAKGGIALAVVQQLGLPIRFIGAGEGIEDLRPFSSFEFVEALLSG